MDAEGDAITASQLAVSYKVQVSDTIIKMRSRSNSGGWNHSAMRKMTKHLERMTLQMEFCWDFQEQGRPIVVQITTLALLVSQPRQMIVQKDSKAINQ